MRYYIYGYTDTGSVPEKNEDAVLVNKEVINEGFREAVLDAPFITAVCDGVGGENAGDVASWLCLKELAGVEYNSKTDIKQALMAIHGKIKKRSTLDRASTNMQTTLCAFAVDEEGKGLCINVGDSRLYRYVNGTIRQLTTDQSLGQYMYNRGEIDDVEELEPKYRSAIISAMGSPQIDPQIDQTPLVNEFGAEPDDMIIITSDGISDFVSESEFEVGLSMDLPISEKLVALAKLAILNGGTDNVSIIGIKPFIDFEELAALTRHDAVGKTVNVMEMLGDQAEEEKDELSDILTIDLEAIIGKSKPKPQPQPEPEIEQEPEPELQPELDIEPVSEPECIIEPEPEQMPELETELELLNESDTESGYDHEPETQEPESQSEPETEQEPEPECIIKPKHEQMPELETELEMLNESYTESGYDHEPETWEPELQSEPEIEQESECEPEPELEPEFTPGSDLPSEEHREMVSREDIELETHDLFMQAQASLSRLSGLIPKKKKTE